MTWRLWWEHTSMLVEEAHSGADADITEISRPRPSRSPPGWRPITGHPTRPGCPGWPASIRNDAAAHTPRPCGKRPAGRGTVYLSGLYWERSVIGNGQTGYQVQWRRRWLARQQIAGQIPFSWLADWRPSFRPRTPPTIAVRAFSPD